MTDAFGIVLDSASVRWAAADPETVVAAVLLLDERSIDEIVAKLRPGELEQVIKPVRRSPRCYPPGTLDALKSHRQVPSPEPVATASTNVGSRRPAAPMKPSAEHMRQIHEHRLARLRNRLSCTSVKISAAAMREKLSETISSKSSKSVSNTPRTPAGSDLGGRWSRQSKTRH
jgi:hypothetical protein